MQQRGQLTNTLQLHKTAGRETKDNSILGSWWTHSWGRWTSDPGGRGPHSWRRHAYRGPSSRGKPNGWAHGWSHSWWRSHNAWRGGCPAHRGGGRPPPWGVLSRGSSNAGCGRHRGSRDGASSLWSHHLGRTPETPGSGTSSLVQTENQWGDAHQLPHPQHRGHRPCTL